MTNPNQTPTIVGFVADLMFTSRIERVANHLGFHMEWIERDADLGQAQTAVTQETPGESVHGQKGLLFTQITRWQPVLLLFDLGNEAIPWRRWIPALKSSPATRRMPILCYGPHVDVELMTTAKELGADAVLARSRFSASMDKLFQQYARIPDYAGVQAGCDQPLSDLARQGIGLHNQGEYFEAHEKLEEAWNADDGPARDLYRALVQLTVAYLQVQRGNYRGAVKMCLRLPQWLEPLPDQCRGIDVVQLKQGVRQLHDALLAGGPEGLDQLDPALLQPIPIE